MKKAPRELKDQLTDSVEQLHREHGTSISCSFSWHRTEIGENTKSTPALFTFRHEPTTAAYLVNAAPEEEQMELDYKKKKAVEKTCASVGEHLEVSL